MNSKQYVVSKEGFLELVTDTIAWADELSEKWTGTTYQKIIDSQKEKVINASKMTPHAYDNFNSFLLAVNDLAITLNIAEEEYAKIEG